MVKGASGAKRSAAHVATESISIANAAATIRVSVRCAKLSAVLQTPPAATGYATASLTDMPPGVSKTSRPKITVSSKAAATEVIGCAPAYFSYAV